MWKIVDETNIQKFLDKVSSEEVVYKKENKPERVANYIEMLNKGDIIWWYDTPKFSLHLGIRILDDGQGKVWMAVPVGAIMGKEAASLLFKKMCDTFEELGIEEFFGRFLRLSHYSNRSPMKGMLQNLNNNVNPNWDNVSNLRWIRKV